MIADPNIAPQPPEQIATETMPPSSNSLKRYTISYLIRVEITYLPTRFNWHGSVIGWLSVSIRLSVLFTLQLAWVCHRLVISEHSVIDFVHASTGMGLPQVGYQSAFGYRLCFYRLVISQHSVIGFVLIGWLSVSIRLSIFVL